MGRHKPAGRWPMVGNRNNATSGAGAVVDDADVNFACRPAHRTEAIQGRHSISSTGEKWGRTRKVTCGDGEIVVTHLRVMPKWVSSEIPTFYFWTLLTVAT